MPRALPAADVEKFEEIYIDETSQTGHRNLIIGGIVLPQRFSDKFEQVILEARRPRLAAEQTGTEELRELKWSDIRKGEFEAYKPVVDAYFDFEEKHIGTGIGTVEFQCTVVLTQVRGRTFSGARGRVPFNKEVFQHCFKIALYHKASLFHLHPDRRYSDDGQQARYDSSLRKKLRGLLIRAKDARNTAVRKVESLHSHDRQALQVADLLIGAVAFRLNRHYDKDSANPDKVRLCDYILDRAGAGNYIDGERGVFRPKTSGRFQIWQQRRAEAIRNPPVRRKPAVPKEEPVNSPVTLGHLVADGKLLWVCCRGCGRERDVNPSTVLLPATTPVPDVGKHMRCSQCGSRDVKTKPELCSGGVLAIRARRPP